MRKILFTISLSFFSYFISAQTNLVPNPSFESYTTCPNSGGTIGFATGWLNFGQTPDYYNSCANMSLPSIGVPSNNAGYQNAKDGNGYAGIITYCCSGYREFVGIALTQTLSIGTKYYVSAYISRADSSPYFCSASKFGFRFSKNTFDSFNPPPINNSSHVHSNTIVSDSLGWTKISGSFISDSAYKYFIVGNFYDDTNTNTSQCSSMGVGAYYYVDETCVSTDSTLCNIVTGIIKNNIDASDIAVYPNPAINNFTIKIPYYLKNCLLEIYDVYGNKALTQQLNNLKNCIDISAFDDGLFFLKVIHNNQLYNYKLIKHKP